MASATRRGAGRVQAAGAAVAPRTVSGEAFLEDTGGDSSGGGGGRDDNYVCVLCAWMDGLDECSPWMEMRRKVFFFPMDFIRSLFWCEIFFIKINAHGPDLCVSQATAHGPSLRSFR